MERKCLHAVLPSSFKSKRLTRSSLRQMHPKLFLTGETPEEDWQEQRGCHLESLGHLWRPHMESKGVCKCHAVGPKSGASDTWQHRVKRACDRPQQLSPSALPAGAGNYQDKDTLCSWSLCQAPRGGGGWRQPDLCLPGTAPPETTQLSLASPGHFMKAF